jgi:RNA polymerase sigma-70 factor (ECF subfamily)
MSDDARIRGLLARAQAGDAEAFGELYGTYATRVYRFLLAQVEEPADAEDLTSEIFLKVLGSLERYEDRGLPFGAWLFRVARNTLIDTGRRTRPSTALDDASEPALQGGQQDALERAAERADIRTALERLTPDQRDVILLRFFAGLSPQEIGSIMGKPRGTVAVLQFRALAALRRRMSDEQTWCPASGEVPA